MSKRPKLRVLGGAEGGRAAEWVGGIVSLRNYVTGEGEGGPYRPEALLWLDGNGMVVHADLARPGEMLGRAAENLARAIEQPMDGHSHAPTRVRVASADLAAALRAGHPDLMVECAPTPELDAVVEDMQEALARDDPEDATFLLPEIAPEACASFFRAAAALYRAAPWEVVPSDQDILALEIPELGIRGAVLSVIGQMGENLGFVLFEGLDDLETFCSATGDVDHGAWPDMPRHLSLNFDPRDEIPPALAREIREHGWEVAGKDAYPWLIAVDEDIVPRPPTAREMTTGEAVARALTALLDEREELDAAWELGVPLSRSRTVSTHAGEIEVTLGAPYDRIHPQPRPRDGLLAELHDLVQDGEVVDEEACIRVEDELMDRFAQSPEAEGLSELDGCALLLEYARNYRGETVATLRPAGVREILFELFPRKWCADPSDARGIVAAIRALYAFLKREFGLSQADACLRVLGGDAVERLEEALSDSSSFGMGKSMLLAGQEAGFDMDTQEGVEAWMRAVNEGAFPLDLGAWGPPQASPQGGRAAKRAKSKKKRKASRKSRKRNR